MFPGGWELLVILVIVMVLFGTKKLRNIGKDLGGAIKGFKDATKTGDKGDEQDKEIPEQSKDDKVIEGEVTSKENHKV